MTRTDLFYLLCLVLLGFAAVLPGINGTALLAQGDEYMHIATVRESIDAESYFLPILNGGTNYHKPPLLFWLGMISESIFGRSLWAARIPAVLLAVLSVVLVYGTLRTLRTPRLTSFLVATVYLFSLAIIKFGRLLMMEQALVASMLGVAFFFVRYMRFGRMSDVFFAGLISAVAYLYKGPLFQVYSGLMLTTYALCWLWRFDLNPIRWRGRESFWRIVRVYFVFHVPLIVPAAWIAIVYFASSSGGLLLQYFFQFENINKFLEPNQPELRIFGGWLMYTLPWTILVGAMSFAAFRSRIRTPARLAGWILLWTAVLITLLHLLPNRKDGYYILPAWPLALIGIARLVSFRGDFFRRYAFWNTVSVAFVAMALLIPGFLLAADAGFFIWAVASLVIPLVQILRWKSSSDRARHAGTVLSGALLICAFQFAAMPLVDRPDAPVAVREQLAPKLCVVSHETWDGFVYKNLLPGYDIQHSIPGSPNGCVDGSRGLIAYRLEDYTPPAGYRQVAAWPVWIEGLTTEEVLAGLRDPVKLQMNIVYYQPGERRP
ncbi:MAG: glycosyltransferase family 39 protein [Leptospirales bacterium]|jgi:4-amino-4-deoxy-L-arabinose transferase-like glycosyltransferase